MSLLMSLSKDVDQDTSTIPDASGRRPRRKAAVSASKSLRATRDSPDAPSSDDEYKGDSVQEADEVGTDDDDIDSPSDEDEDL